MGVRSSEQQGISIVIPVYNEENSIVRVITQIKEALNQFLYQILIVDDGSRDNTGTVAKEQQVDVIFNETSLGYGAALRKGFENSKYEIIVSLDGDGQYDPRDIPRLVDPILMHRADIVIGSRFSPNSKIRPYSLNSFQKIGIYIFR